MWHSRTSGARRSAHGGGEVVEDVGRALVEHHFDEDERAKSQPMRVEPRADAGNQPGLHEPARPFAGTGGGEADAVGEFEVRDPAPALKDAQDQPVSMFTILHDSPLLDGIDANHASFGRIEAY